MRADAKKSLLLYEEADKRLKAAFPAKQKGTRKGQGT